MDVEMITDPDHVTAAWLTAVLRESGALDDGEVTAFTAAAVGTGQVGLNMRYVLETSDGSGPSSIVAKFASPDETSRATGVALGNYDKEVWFYDQLRHTVDVQTPIVHFAKGVPGTADLVIVMEDLAPAVQGDQLTGCTVDEAALAMTQAAALHGPRWGDTTLDEIEWLGRSDAAESAAMTQGMYAAVVDSFRERYADRLTPTADAVAEAFGPHVATWMQSPAPPYCLVHGDYRLDNMMFGTPEGGYPLAIVDWQTPGVGRGLADVAYFLGAGLLTEDRRASERDLVKLYHDALLSHGVTGFSFDDAWHDYRYYAFAGVVMAVVASMIVVSTERGDEMFMAMANRHAAHADDLDATALLPAML